MTVKRYLLSFPERLLRSAVGFGAGVAREVGEVALSDGVRRSQLYCNLVDAGQVTPGAAEASRGGRPTGHGST